MIWQLLFILLSTTWLLAPHLNHLISYRTALISQYENPGQPYSWLFRLGDAAGASLLIFMGLWYLKNLRQVFVGWALVIIGTGMLVDPLIPTTCLINGEVCEEYFSAGYLIHAIETVVTASSLLIIAVYDVWLRRRVLSIAFTVFQILYFGLFVSNLASRHEFNTLSQYLYQLTLITWLAWFCRDFASAKFQAELSQREIKLVKYSAAAWAFINGIISILISLAHLHLVGKIRSIYFAGDNAWLAQHGVVIGVIMLYLSRHLVRGERRARQIFLVILGLETFKYSVITPHPLLMIFYLTGFVGLFVLRDCFRLGVIPLTWRVRLKDAAYMVGALFLAALLGLSALYRGQRSTHVANRSFEDFFDYTWHNKITHKPDIDIQSALLAHTISAFVLVGIAVILWILFRPNKPAHRRFENYDQAKTLLQKYSTSSEDYFKTWPRDKRLYWNKAKTGFIAYKIVGPIAFALADPICIKDQRQILIKDFVSWCRRRRLRACFLPIYDGSLRLYQKSGLDHVQIGASALIDIQKFLKNTTKDKWWRWKTNRALKSGYVYGRSFPPHAQGLLSELRQVSNEWLAFGGHSERGFALGFFDESYLNECTIHFLKSAGGKVEAFTNQPPMFKSSQIFTIDLLRYRPEADDSIPYLLLKTIEDLARNKEYKNFDLGFVPFTASRDPMVRLASLLSRGRFSARGLEQFKNKFEPDWRPNYLAYDGDMTDLTLIALHIEQLMNV